MCSVCWCERGEKATQLVSSTLEGLIQFYLLETYSIEDRRFPCGICTKCRIILYKWRDAEEGFVPEAIQPYRKLAEAQAVISRMETRSSSMSMHFSPLYLFSYPPFFLAPSLIFFSLSIWFICTFSAQWTNLPINLLLR